MSSNKEQWPVAAEVLATANQRYLVLEDFLTRTVVHGQVDAARRSQLADDFAAKLDVSRATFYRLLARHSAGGTVRDLLPRPRGMKIGKQRLPPEVEAIIKQEIQDFYKTRERPRIADLVDQIRARCYEKGLRRPNRLTIRARIAALPRDEVHRARYGSRSARHKFSPVVGEMEASRPLQVIQIDHTRADVFVVDETTREPIQRPWLTLAIDVHTRMISGFYLSLDPPSTTSLAICLALSVIDKAPLLASQGIEGEWPVHGIPELFHVDNAKEFRSRAFTEASDLYAIAIDYRPIKTPHYGGHIERLIGTMMGDVHILPGTTFSSVEDKKQYDSARHAALTLPELQRWLLLNIVGKYHQRVHRALDMPPIEKWRQTSKGRPLRVPNKPRDFFVDFLPSEERQVRRDGLHLYKIRYWSDALTPYLINEKKVRVHYDPRNLSKVFVRGGSGEFLDVPYRNLGRQPITLWEHRAACSQLRKAGRTAVDEELIFETVKQLRLLVTGAKAATLAARRKAALVQPVLIESSATRQLAKPEHADQSDEPILTPLYRVRHFND